MQLRLIVTALAISGALSAQAQTPAGDSSRGQQIFTSQNCAQCHNINGQGGKTASDLVKGIGRDYTPSALASMMWNHAPDMWGAMTKAGVARPALTAQQASDLFAFFVSARYFDQPADAGRGKRAFADKGCEGCHGIASSPLAAAPPVVKWESLASPMLLAQQMWNHSARMGQAFTEKKAARAPLTGQDLSDILVYLRNAPETRSVPREFRFASASQGPELFQSKGCQGCHTGRNTLEGKLRDQSPTDIAAAMWNHQPSMKSAGTLAPDEMRQILDYVWMRQFITGNGSVDRGGKVFAAKNCGSCHNQTSGGAPRLTKVNGPYSDITIISTLWQHGPQMLESMKAKKLAWPQFANPQEMSDLIAYLNSL